MSTLIEETGQALVEIGQPEPATTVKNAGSKELCREYRDAVTPKLISGLAQQFQNQTLDPV
jgi:hypothetical protein